jgi:hypothetical protein
MRLKILTTISLIAGFALLIGFPLIVGSPPAKGASKRDLANYSRRASGVLGGFVLCIVASGIGSYLVIRQARQEYREQAAKNVSDLLEAARADASKKRDAEG